ncbi:MAG: hypothetical protein ACR2PM_10480 [Hyphomicrobiales bacterium]
MENWAGWTIAITVALSVASTLGVTYFGHRLGLAKKKLLRQDELDRHARYQAIRVVCTLDPFVSECCNVVYDHGLPGNEGVMYPQVADPTISFPEDMDWKPIKPDLMYRVLGVPIGVDIARQSIDSVAENIAEPPDRSEYFEERIIQYGRLGLAALVLADEIRHAYNIPERDFADWHPKETLERAVAIVEEEREESQARQREIPEEATVATETKPGGNGTEQKK